MQPYSNIELTEGIKNRDEQIMSWIIQRCKPAIRQLVLNNGGSEDEVDDVFHDGLLDIIEKILYNDLMISNNIQALLHVTCKRNLVDKIRKEKTSQKYYSEFIRKFEYADPGIDPEVLTKKKALRLAMNDLDDVCRQIIVLRLQGIPMDKMTEYIDKSYNYIRKKHPGCMDNLQRFTKEHFLKLHKN